MCAAIWDLKTWESGLGNAGVPWRGVASTPGLEPPAALGSAQCLQTPMASVPKPMQGPGALPSPHTAPACQQHASSSNHTCPTPAPSTKARPHEPTAACRCLAAKPPPPPLPRLQPPTHSHLAPCLHNPSRRPPTHAPTHQFRISCVSHRWSLDLTSQMSRACPSAGLEAICRDLAVLLSSMYSCRVSPARSGKRGEEGGVVGALARPRAARHPVVRLSWYLNHNTHNL